jgi:hypothetical protein
MRPSRDFNADTQRHADVFVAPARDRIALRYPDFSPTGFELQRSKLVYTDPRGIPGHLRLDHHEVLPTPEGELVFHRGGTGYADAENVKYGHVAVAELASAPGPPVPSGGGRGRACPLSTRPQDANGHVVRVRQAPLDMLYKRPQDPPAGKIKTGAKWMHYADPGAGQGDRHDIHYSVLCWSWLNARGGGMLRGLLREGELFQRCDVRSIRMGSWDKAGNPNGSVVAVYGRILRAGHVLFGWAMYSHRYDPHGGRGETVYHLERRS